MTWSNDWLATLRTECDAFMRTSNAAAVAVVDRLAGTLVLLGDSQYLNVADIREYLSSRRSRKSSDEVQMHSDSQRSVLLGSILNDGIIAVGFDERTSIGLVRLRLRHLRKLLQRLDLEAPSDDLGKEPPN